MERTNIHLAADQKDRLRRLAERCGVSVADLIRRAIEVYLDREEKRDSKRGVKP